MYRIIGWVVQPPERGKQVEENMCRQVDWQNWEARLMDSQVLGKAGRVETDRIEPYP